MKVIRLVRIDFDSLENHDPISEQEIGIFGPDPYTAVRQFFAEMPHMRLYVGYDNRVYPQWRLEEKTLQPSQESKP